VPACVGIVGRPAQPVHANARRRCSRCGG
jgi:hypothetical protein